MSDHVRTGKDPKGTGRMSVATEAGRVSQGAANRSWRNYLLNPQFQLKYTGMVVGVTAVVASVLGFAAYAFAHSLTEMSHVAMLNDPNVDPSLLGSLDEMMATQDRKTLLSIVGGILILCAALGLTGILVTHKIVGPAYKLQLLIRHLAEGRVELVGRLRDGDELQDVFKDLERMVDSWRRIQAEEIADLEAGLEAARRAGVTDDQIARIVAVRDRMRAALDV